MIAALALILCQPAIYDADSFVCTDQYENSKRVKVRLRGISAREANGTCKTGHPCPDMMPGPARAILVDMLGGEVSRWSTGHIVTRDKVRCIPDGRDKYGRITAWCYTMSGVDISCAMIASGAAAKWDRYWKRHRCG